MPLVHRRTFFGKVGAAEQLVQHLHEGEKELQQYGFALKSRVLTDYMSGRTDRIVWEVEADDLKDIDAAFERMMTDPQGEAFMRTWFAKLAELIHYAEVENWHVH